MLEPTISVLIPTDLSESFYKAFYKQFSFIQVNHVIMMQMREFLTEDNLENLLSKLNNFNEDQHFANICSIGAGIMNPALMRRSQENRGISLEIFNILRKENLDPLDWYENAIEFLMVYATCEQAIKEYLVSKGKSSNEIKENKILNNLFDELKNGGLRDNFIKELKNGSSEVISSQNELLSAWKYYTLFRHTLVHASGIKTERMENKMRKVIESNKSELKNINEAMFYELDDIDEFFSSPFEGTVISINDKHLNFFRNMAILIVESLERAINPSEYEISDFNPYKFKTN